MLSLHQDLVEVQDKGEQVDAIVIDLAKAFDVVDHDLLMKKINVMGLDNRLIKWIESFIKDRHQKVKIGDSQSPEIDVTSGVAQGSVLGPLLFLIFINDMPNAVKSRVRLFADDCIIYRKIINEVDSEKLQKDLNALINWLRLNRLDINSSKCRAISFNKNKTEYPYSIGEYKIPKENEVKYLGITFSSNLKWNAHIGKVLMKANKALNFVIRTLGKSSKKVKEIAYKSLVRPLLEYGECLWDPHEVGLKKSLEKVQRRAARFVLGRYDRKHSVTRMLKELGWKSLESRRTEKRLTIFFKVFTGHPSYKELRDRVSKSEFLVRHDHNYKLNYMKQKTNVSKFCFLNRAVETWNSLPAEALEPFPTSLRGFKKVLKTIRDL